MSNAEVILETSPGRHQSDSVPFSVMCATFDLAGMNCELQML